MIGQLWTVETEKWKYSQMERVVWVFFSYIFLYEINKFKEKIRKTILHNFLFIFSVYVFLPGYSNATFTNFSFNLFVES
jgi:hypothetical protein